MKTYDLVVIGSGPGGLRAAIQAAKLGKSVAVVEKERAGGSSVHTGTIPSKSLREAALMSQTSFAKAVARVRGIVQLEEKVVLAQLKRNGVEFFSGAATFLTANEVQVKKKILRGTYFVVATGTSPIRNPEFPFHLKGVHDSDSILRLKQLPKSLLIIGAGVIGCEYASIYARLGAKVTVVDRRKELLRTVDPEAVESLRKEFALEGIPILMSSEYGGIKKAATGSTKLELKLNGKKARFDAVLVCMGRAPNTADLGLAAIGVKTDERGFVVVDRKDFRTNVSHIYAVGDVIGPPGLAASSAEQGRIASCRIFGEPCPDFPASFPYGIYTIPEISSVGMQESEAKEKNIPYVVGRAAFGEIARGLIMGDRNGFVKIIVSRENRRILGVHAIGVAATELVHIGQAVLALDAPVDFLVNNVFNYPTFAEAYKVAALHAANLLKITKA